MEISPDYKDCYLQVKPDFQMLQDEAIACCMYVIYQLQWTAWSHKVIGGSTQSEQRGYLDAFVDQRGCKRDKQ
jgi:hypothetical protein